VQCIQLLYSEFVNQIKQLPLFILQKGDVDGFNLLKTAEINFEKKILGDKNVKQTNITRFLKFNIQTLYVYGYNIHKFQILNCT